MNKEAFNRGFFKAAMASGLDVITATQLLKQAGLFDSLGVQNPMELQNIQQQALINTGGNAGLGALAGAGAGGLAGYIGGQNKAHPENDHRYRDAMLLASLGGLGGAGVGAGIGGIQGLKQLSDYTTSHPFALKQ